MYVQYLLYYERCNLYLVLLLYYCIERGCMYEWCLGLSQYLPCLGSCCLPVCLSTRLPCRVTTCPVLPCLGLRCLSCMSFFSCLVLSCLWPCLVLHCLVLSWIGVVLRVALSCLFCLVLPCLALLVTDLVSSPESACLSALPCRVLGLALPCLVWYLDLSCLALSCLVCYLDLSCLALSCVALRGLALSCLVFSAGRDT